MKKCIATFIISTACCFHANSQNPDSGYLNLGRISIKRDFAQTISIKPEYLEKMPFTNLAEAVNAWFYGNFTNSATLIYVVDGNIVPDVNVYSIHEIEEIMLVQNAMVQLNGASGQAQLVVIKTKRNKSGKFGAVASAQLFLVNNNLKSQTNNSHFTSDNNLYHQYYLSAYQNKEKIQYRASVNFLRDVLPSIKAVSIHTNVPDNIARFRMNAYLNAQLGKDNELFIDVNYTPQVIKFDQDMTAAFFAGPELTYKKNLRQPEKIFSPHARLHSNFLNKWSNDFSAGYYLFDSKQNTNSVSPGIDTNSTFSSISSLTRKSNLLLLEDRICYNGTFGDWEIDPSIDFRFSHIKESENQSLLNYYNNTLQSSSGYSSYAKGNIYLLTPSVSISYKNIFNIQGGFLQNLSSPIASGAKRTFPFVSGTIDIFKISGSRNDALRLFGSYARSGYFADPDFTLFDFVSSVSGNFFGNVSPILNGGQYYFPYKIDYSTWIAEGGVSWGTMHGPLKMGYNFERRVFNAAVLILTPYYGATETIYTLVGSSTHRLSIDIKILEKEKVNWFSGFNITSLAINKGTLNYFVAEYATGDYNTSKPSFTGGWMNRIRYRNYLFGLDMLYHFSEQVFSTTSYGLTGQQRKNSLLVQNVYVGYQYKSSEFYIDARNLFQNSNGDLTNGNRYYGLGFKMSLSQ